MLPAACLCDHLATIARFALLRPHDSFPRFLSMFASATSVTTAANQSVNMSFGWSVGDLVGAAQLLWKIMIALKDAGGASDEYGEETAFLQSLVFTLRHLDALQFAPLERDVLLSLQEHCIQVREPVLLFLKDIQHRFQGSLGQKQSWTNAVATSRKVQWALSVSKRVRRLRRRISGSIDAIQLCLSHQTL